MLIKVFKQNRKTVFGILIFCAAALAMTSFGVGPIMGSGGPRQENAAIQIDDMVVSYPEFYREKRGIERQYRQMFGTQFDEMAKLLGINPSQQAIDRIVTNKLLERELKRLGFVQDPDTTKNFIKSSFGNTETLAEYARTMDMSSSEFVENLSSSLYVQQFADLVSNITKPTERELRGLVRSEETKLDVALVPFDPEKYLDKVQVPSNEDLEGYFTKNASKYELPERVLYEYVVFEPSTYEKEVEITEEDIQGYYVDNQSDYMLPEKVKVQILTFKISDNASKEEVEEVKKRAEEAHKKIKEGTPFDKIFEEYAPTGENLVEETLTRGTRGADFDAAVFKMKDGGLADLVKIKGAFLIANVLEFTPKTPKEMAEVRTDIQEKIRKSEAPVFAAAKAQEFHDKWLNQEKPFTQLLAELNLPAPEKTSSFLTREEDPSNILQGLTAKILSDGEEKQLITLGEKTILVNLIEQKPEEIPPYSDTKDKVLTDYKKEEAKKLAESAANEFLSEFQKDEEKDLRSFAKAKTLLVEERKSVKRSEPGSNVLSDKAVHSAVFSTNTPFEKPTQVFQVNNVPYIMQVVSVILPTDDEIEASIPKYERRQSNDLSEVLIKSLVNKLKKDSEIHIDDALYAEQTDDF